MKLSHVILSLALFVSLPAKASNESGNGGFAYQVSFDLLQTASRDLVRFIPLLPADAFQMIQDTPNYRERLASLVTYEHLDLRASEERSRMGRPLALDYAPSGLIILKPFFVTYAGTRNEHFLEATRLIQRELLHEAAHLFGLNEHLSTLFSNQMMLLIGGLPAAVTNPMDEATQQEARRRFQRFVGYLYDNAAPCFYLLSVDREGEYTLAVTNPSSLPNWEPYFLTSRETCPFRVGNVARLRIVSINEIGGDHGGYVQILQQTGSTPPRLLTSIAGVAFSVLRIWHQPHQQ